MEMGLSNQMSSFTGRNSNTHLEFVSTKRNWKIVSIASKIFFAEKNNKQLFVFLYVVAILNLLWEWIEIVLLDCLKNLKTDENTGRSNIL